MILNNKKLLISAALVFILTIFVYLPALQNGFVNWDDGINVYENLYIRSFDHNLLSYMFSFKDTMWIPLTRLSHALNYAVWGLDPMGHHLTNILFHGSNAFLVVILVFRLMTYRKGTNESPFPDDVPVFGRALVTAVLTGILFGIHPLRVESVAWVTERKDVLSGFFVLLSLIYYLKFSAVFMKNRMRVYYVLSLVFFFMAMICKPMVVTLPAVLVILDIYPLRRFNSSQLRVIAEKVPFFVLGLVLSVVTIISYKQEGAMVTESDFALIDRLLVAVRSLFFYLYKMVWPVDLAPYYMPSFNVSIYSIEYAGPLVLFLIISVYCIYTWEKYKALSAAWLFYLVTLLPVLGVIQFSYNAPADRFTYLASLGPFFLVALVAALIYEKKFSGIDRKKLFLLPPVVVICVLSYLTVKQIRIWEDSFSLWNRAVEVQASHIACNNRGNEYLAQGRYREAITDYDTAIELAPEFPRSYSNRGTANFMLGRYQEAILDYDRAIRLSPGHASLYYNRGIAYLKSERYLEAITDLNKAAELDSGHALTYYSRGLCYRMIENIDRSNRDFQQAARLGDKKARAYLGSTGMDY